MERLEYVTRAKQPLCGECGRAACVFVDHKGMRRYACAQHAKHLPHLAQAGAVLVLEDTIAAVLGAEGE